MRASILLSLAFLALLAGCRPIQTQHAFDHVYPRTRTDFEVRWIGTTSGRPAVWITTANDLEKNGRYEGVHLLIDPGTPEDVEEAVLPYLAENGLPPGAPVAYVVVTGGDARAEAGARRLAREYPVGTVVTPPPAAPGSRGARPGKLPAYLKIAPEVSVRTFRPVGTAGIPNLALLVRFIDAQFVFLPEVPAEAASEWADAVGEMLEREGLHGTVVAGPPGTVDFGHLSPEVVIGSGAPESALSIARPSNGEAVVLATNGSEMRAPGPRLRSRYGHWIDCSAAGALEGCVGELATAEAGPVLVPLVLDTGSEPAWFLVDTRAPYSYLVRPRWTGLPGAGSGGSHGHSHGGAPIGTAIPAFRLGADPKAPRLVRWHVLPVAPFQVGGRDVAGVIGMDLLQSFEVTVRPGTDRLVLRPNFGEERTRLGEPANRQEGGTSTWDVPMDRSPGGPLLLGKVDGAPKSLVVDLASGRSVMHLPGDREGSSYTVRSRGVFRVPDDIAEAAWEERDIRAAEVRVSVLELFGLRFGDQAILATEHPIAADVLGMDFLSRFDEVTLDFRQRVLRLKRSTGTAAESAGSGG